MKIIDIHTHIYPDEIAQKAVDSVRRFYHIGQKGMSGTVETLLERGKKAGISKYVILPVAIRPDRVRSINEYVKSEAEKHDCFIPFGTVHAAMENIEAETDYIIQSGAKGVKMHPDSQGFAIDDERLFPMYDAVGDKIPVLLHMGDSRSDFSHPARLKRLLKLFPRLQVIASHFGGHTMYETAYENLKDTFCVFDISSSLMFMPKENAEGYIKAYGAERLAFGTDYPIWDPVTEVESFLRLNLTENEFEQIAHKTAERVLKL